MDQLTDVNNALFESYSRWYCEVLEKCSLFLEEEYSNPYYICIPKGWFDNKVRIMIVGEEGHGKWGCGKQNHEISGKDVSAIQTFNWSYLAKQLYNGEYEYNLYPEAYSEEWNRSAFWKRARKLSAYGVCAWTNIDKVHRLGFEKCALTEKERILLHSLDTRMLYEEIELLNPTHVVFFGWYGISLKHELQEIYEKLYVKSDDGRYIWEKNIVPIDYNSRHYLFTYHPNWGYRQTGYEDRVIGEFEKQLKGK